MRGRWFPENHRQGKGAGFHLFLNHGYQAFVLNYTTKTNGDGAYPAALYDLAKMIVTVREHAEEWNIESDQIAVVGFSAGGSVCASLAASWNEKFLAEKIGTASKRLKPDAAILAYPVLDFIYQRQKIADDKNRNTYLKLVNMKKQDFLHIVMEAAVGKSATEEKWEKASPINHITSDMPPVFLWGTADDDIVYTGQILRFAEKLSDQQVPFELHVFESGHHGLSLANYNTTNRHEKINHDVSIWTGLAVAFLNRHFQHHIQA